MNAKNFGVLGRLEDENFIISTVIVEAYLPNGTGLVIETLVFSKDENGEINYLEVEGGRDIEIEEAKVRINEYRLKYLSR